LKAEYVNLSNIILIYVEYRRIKGPRAKFVHSRISCWKLFFVFDIRRLKVLAVMIFGWKTTSVRCKELKN
jgi:hypothetical protein